ncbi:hypothetical protein B0H16DRAFT_1724661 [Mycena metata]|uniref:Uncharacterized protein n=1 Tax=Mycena metata TaxID=1033252 RepID=A0AAD7N8B0_9AGAR|nr:hypothetical protein B0H16DRAFT_1724661 [Mycena metata]
MPHKGSMLLRHNRLTFQTALPATNSLEPHDRVLRDAIVGISGMATREINCPHRTLRRRWDTHIKRLLAGTTPNYTRFQDYNGKPYYRDLSGTWVEATMMPAQVPHLLPPQGRVLLPDRLAP